MLKFSGCSCLIGGPNESWGVFVAAGTLTSRQTTPRAPSSRESRRPGGNAPSTTLCACGASGKTKEVKCVQEVRCTRSSRSGTRRVRLPSIGQEDRSGGASGVNRHSDKHAPRHIPEAQVAFKILMIHWILQVARRIAFRCVLHRCGSQDIRR